MGEKEYSKTSHYSWLAQLFFGVIGSLIAAHILNKEPMNVLYVIQDICEKIGYNLPSVRDGSITVESDIAGLIYIDGKATARWIKAGGTETINNVSTGYTEVAVMENDGIIIKAPQAVMVQKGQTAAIVVERPVPEEPAFELIEGKSAIITKYSGNAATVHIPEQIQGLPVTAIADLAFLYCSRLTSIIIPSSVTTIGSGAFSGCYNLTNVTIPSSVTTIREFAFSGCFSLTRATLSRHTQVEQNSFPDSVQIIYSD